MLRLQVQEATVKVQEADLQVGRVRTLLHSRGIKFDQGDEEEKSVEDVTENESESDDEETGMSNGDPLSWL